MTNEDIAKIILQCEQVERLPQKGNRNCGIYVSVGTHKFSEKFPRATCKFYKGDGSTKGFQEGYMPFHKRGFPRIPALKNKLIQQSLECGVFANGATSRPYSVFQFIEGEMLRAVVGNKDAPIDAPTISEDLAKSILRDMFCEVWIPLWNAGVRFRDGHTGNWVLGDDKRAYMIDTEQMRKDAAELLDKPTSWKQRERHEAMCLKLVKGIFADLCNACGKSMTDSKASKLIEQTNFLSELSALGKTSTSPDRAITEFEACLKLFF